MDFRYIMGGWLSIGKMFSISRLLFKKKNSPIIIKYRICFFFFFIFTRDDAVIAKDFQFHDFLNKMSQFPALLMMMRMGEKD